jgi:hypothetical protein
VGQFDTRSSRITYRMGGPTMRLRSAVADASDEVSATRYRPMYSHGLTDPEYAALRHRLEAAHAAAGLRWLRLDGG